MASLTDEMIADVGWDGTPVADPHPHQARPIKTSPSSCC
jgi:hypothetical protein